MLTRPINSFLTLLWASASLCSAGAPVTSSESVEVTATRFLEPAEDVPASIEAITGEELRNWGAQDLQTALALAAGVDVAPGGDNGPAASVPEMWGLKERDAFLLVVDGTPWGGAFNPDLPTLDLHDVERVEILRGPAPVMYGATSFVGVIQVVHKDAGAGTRLLRATGGSYESGGLSVSTPFSLGAISSSFGLDLGRQGYTDDRTSFRRGHVLWRNERRMQDGRLRFDVDGTWLDQDPASPHPRQGASLSPLIPLDANYNPDGAFLNDRRVAASTSFEKSLGHAGWYSSLSISRSRQDSFRGFLNDVVSPVSPARGVREIVDMTDIYFDSHIEWTLSPRTKILAGVDHLHGNADAQGADFDYDVAVDGLSIAKVAAPTVLDVKIGDRRDFSGVYSFGEWTPSATWRIEAGLRLNRTAEDRGEGDAPDLAGAAEGDAQHVRLSGSAGISWTPWEREGNRLRLFANYRNTFKPAAIDFGIGEGEGEEGLLEPETAQSYQLGLRARGLGGKASFEVSSFLMDFRNLVIAQAVNGLPALANAGQERFKGIDFALALRLPKHVTARATYSIHDARFRDFLTEFDGVPTQLAGKQLEMSARQLGSMGLFYMPERGVFGGVAVNAVGRRFLNKRNTATADAYATWSASLGCRVGAWDLRIDGRNLSDVRAAVSESELGDAQYYRLPGRRIDVGASLRF